jgi:SAM-dependent methyltransferase
MTDPTPDEIPDAIPGAPEARAIVPRPERPPEAGWYRSFFGGLALDMWDQAVPPQVTAAELDLAADILDLDPLEPGTTPVMDVPCGTGRHSLALAARGYEVTAVDGSVESLERLQAAAEVTEIEGRLTVRKADMTALPFKEDFVGAVCFGNSFGYGPPEECRAFLAGVSRALRPGGGFLMHTATVAEALLPGLEPEEAMQIGDVQVAFENRYDPFAGRLDTRFLLTRGEEVLDRLVSHYVFTLAELGRMLAAENMTLEEVYADPYGTPYALGASDDVYVFARKTQ